MKSFDNWAQVLIHVGKGLPIYYHAPMSYRACKVRCKVTSRFNVRVMAHEVDREADNFSAGPAHLSRFKFDC